MFDEAGNIKIYAKVETNEIHRTLKSFSRDKSPGPDGWSIEVFLFFYELLEKDLGKWWKGLRFGERYRGKPARDT